VALYQKLSKALTFTSFGIDVIIEMESISESSNSTTCYDLEPHFLASQEDIGAGCSCPYKKLMSKTPYS